MKVGIIGAGSISTNHINSYLNNKDAELVMISDLNESLAKSRAEQFGIPKYCTDYKELLRDDTIEAVSIATPTFTHCQIVIDALEAGKHVLCEKPPALTVAEAEKCAEAAAKSGKVLMYAFVRRFSEQMQYLKKFEQAGGFGKIYSAEATRISRCANLNGWFIDKNKSGGGSLIDGTIHEVDAALYLMGYPKPKSVLGFSSDVNKDLPSRIQGYGGYYASSDTAKYERTIESVANGFVTFENDACLTIRSGHIQFCFQEIPSIEVMGDKAGARFAGMESITMLTVDSTGYMTEFKPVITQKSASFQKEINHFVDCCVNKTPCISTPEQGIILMSIIEGIYKSAETGKAVTF